MNIGFIILAALSSLRVCMMLAYEPGPFNVFTRLRKLTMKQPVEGCSECSKNPTTFLTCINCMSVWIFPLFYSLCHFINIGWLLSCPFWGSMVVVLLDNTRQKFLNPLAATPFMRHR